ncbi:MAG: hypothetical protein AAFY20_23955 [Cyanobacteria bacterium J06639_14]
MTAQLFPQGSLSKAFSVGDVEISSIIIDDEIVGRAGGLSHQYIAELETCLEELPPVDVFYDGDRYWLADGNHRINAFMNAGENAIACHIHKGDRDDALLFSAGTNAEHGLRRTTADKQAQVGKLLRDEKWAQWSDREIARQCKVSAPFVAKMRRTVNVYSGDGDGDVRLSQRDGKVVPIRTGNIGKKPDIDPAEIRARYERVGRVLPKRNGDGFAVENAFVGAPFPLAFRSAAAAADYWEHHADALERVAGDLAKMRSQVSEESRNPEYMPGDDDWSGAHSDGNVFFAEERVINQSEGFHFSEGDRVIVINPDSEDFERLGTVGEPWDSNSDRQLYAKVMLNGDSLYSRIAYKDLGPAANDGNEVERQKLERVENDYYRTYPELVQVLLDELAGTPHEITGQVLEPTVGDGVIANFFNGCITNDLHPHPDWSPDFQMDATDPLFWQVLQEQGGYDWGVGNPPWLKDVVSKIVQQAYANAGRGVAFLLRLSYLEPTEDRGEWHQQNDDHLRFVIPVNPRPLWRIDTSNSEAVTCCWFLWDKKFSWKALGIKPPFRFARNWREK